MKKLFSLAMAFCLCAAVNAQAETEKYYGAEKGSFAVSIDAMPFVNYAGNFFGKMEANSFDLDAISSEIAAKYFLTDKFALAAKLSVDNDKSVTPVYHDLYHIYSDAIAKSTTKEKNFELNLGAQYYFRPGKRVQPFVGAGIFVGKNNTITLNEGFAYNFKDEDGNEYKGYESTKKDASPAFCFGVAANLGVEFFVAKNISLGTTLDLGVKATSTKTVAEFESSDKESYPAEVQKAMNYTIKNGKNTEFATGLMGGNLSLNFYF